MFLWNHSSFYSKSGILFFPKQVSITYSTCALPTLNLTSSPNVKQMHIQKGGGSFYWCQIAYLEEGKIKINPFCICPCSLILIDKLK